MCGCTRVCLGGSLMTGAVRGASHLGANPLQGTSLLYVRYRPSPVKKHKHAGCFSQESYPLLPPPRPHHDSRGKTYLFVVIFQFLHVSIQICAPRLVFIESAAKSTHGTIFHGTATLTALLAYCSTATMYCVSFFDTIQLYITSIMYL